MTLEHSKAFELIAEKVGEELSKQGFTRQSVAAENDNDLAALFTGDNVAYSVLYAKKKQQMILRKRQKRKRQMVLQGKLRRMRKSLRQKKRKQKANRKNRLKETQQNKFCYYQLSLRLRCFCMDFSCEI